MGLRPPGGVEREAFVSYVGVTDADGAADGTTLKCSAIGSGSGYPDFDGNQVIITSGPYKGQARDINGATNADAAGTITVASAFDGQITSGTSFIITGIRTVPAEVAALQADIGDFSAQTNLKSLLAVLGSGWDTENKTVYDKLVTDLLEHGTYGLAAQNTYHWDKDISGYTGAKAGTYLKSVYDKLPTKPYLMGSADADGGFDAEAKADINAEVDTALSDINLNHLIQTSGTVSDAAPTAGDFDTSLTETTNDHYNDLIILFTSGALAGQSRRISDYDGTSKNITVTPPFTEAPADGDAFVIISGSYLKVVAERLDTQAKTDVRTEVDAEFTERGATSTRFGYLDYLNSDSKYLRSTAIGTPTADSIADEVQFIAHKALSSPAADSVGEKVTNIEIDTEKLYDAALGTSPADGSLASFIATGGTALGTRLPPSKSLYDVIVLDRLDHATYGLAALNTYIWDKDISGYSGVKAGTYLKTLYDDWIDGGRLDLILDAILADTGTDGVVVNSRTNAYKRLAGVTQVIEVSVTSAANAGDVTIATVTDQPCVIDSIIIHADTAQTTDLTSCAVYGGAGKVVTFISDTDATQANLDAADKQVSWTGAVRLAAGKTIVMSLVGTGSTAVDLTVTITYHAAVDGGYLA